LRHTYATRLTRAGLKETDVQGVLGHSSISTTGRYRHARPASEQAARFTRAFRPAVAAPDSATTNGALGSA
jgi:site-specific recombinase XerD